MSKRKEACSIIVKANYKKKKEKQPPFWLGLSLYRDLSNLDLSDIEIKLFDKDGKEITELYHD